MSDRLGDAWRGPRPPGRRSVDSSGRLLPEEAFPLPDEYDVVVIGAGSTGENVADRAIKGGLTAAIAEAELVGGECSYWACMPSKALLRPVAGGRRGRGPRGVRGARLDPPGVLDRRDSFAHHWKDDGQVEWLNGAHIELYRGQGRLTGPKALNQGPGWTSTAAAG